MKDQEARLEQWIAAHRPAPLRVESQQQVELALGALDRLAESLTTSTTDRSIVGRAFAQTNARLYLRFAEVDKGRKKFNVSVGGVVTFGSTPPPGPLHTGPTDRPIIRKMLAAGDPVTAPPERVAPGIPTAAKM